MKVSRWAPSATPRRVISTSPRVMRATRVLAPNLSPSEKPGRDREHVLHGAADFDADDVGRGVGAKISDRQIIGEGGCELGIG